MNGITVPAAGRLHYGTIREGVRLQSLKIPDHQCPVFVMATPLVPITNTVLSCLHLHDYHNIRRLLMNVVLPALTELQLCLDDYCAPPDTTMGVSIRRLVERPQCKLRFPSLGSLTVDEEDLSSTLKSLPSLEGLTIVHELPRLLGASVPTGYTFIQEVTALQNQVHFLPSLRSFSFKDVNVTVPTAPQIVEAFRQFVEDPRRSRDSPVYHGGPVSGPIQVVPCLLGPVGPDCPLENASLFVTPNKTCIYSRVRNR